MPAPLSLLSLLGAGSQGVVVAGGTHAAENLKLVARRLQGECFKGSCLFHWCMKAIPHLFTDSTSQEKPDKRGHEGNVQIPPAKRSQTRGATRGMCRKPDLLHVITGTNIKKKVSWTKKIKND